jgi:putative ABC transport system substrate-binding protein
MDPFRRRIVGGALAALFGAANARAQLSGRPKRVAVFLPFAEASPGGQRMHRQVPQSLQGLGYRIGKDITISWHHVAGDLEKLPEKAAEVVTAKPDVILTQSSVATRAIATTTRTIPIVGLIDDPVREGYVAEGSNVMPVANVTGLADRYSDNWPKLLEFLRACMPGLAKFGIVSASDDANNKDTAEFLRIIEASVRRSGMEPVSGLIRRDEDVVRTFESIREQGVRAAYYALGYKVRAIPELIQGALRCQLALVALQPAPVASYGFLLAYRSSFGDYVGRQATQIDKILRGTPVSRIPFELPDQFTLGINRKTAHALKITIPQDVLLRADSVYDDWEK